MRIKIEIKKKNRRQLTIFEWMMKLKRKINLIKWQKE